MVAHLWLHPQRPIFIEALGRLRTHPLLLLGLILSHLAALYGSAITELPDASMMVWPDFLIVCVADGVMQFGWLLLDVARWHELPTGAWGAHLLHHLWQGCAAAATQVTLCLLCLHETPRLLSSRWRNVIPLALILTLLNACAHLMHGDFQRWIILEALLIAAPLPFCVAVAGVKFIEMGSFMLRLWGKLWVSWIGFAITAIMLLALLNHATRMLALSPGLPSLIASAVMSAVLHLWLFLAGVLLMRNAGYLVSPTSQQ